jgi:hypothetical protein
VARLSFELTIQFTAGVGLELLHDLLRSCPCGDNDVYVIRPDVSGVEEPVFVCADAANDRKYNLPFLAAQRDRWVAHLGSLEVP